MSSTRAAASLVLGALVLGVAAWGVLRPAAAPSASAPQVLPSPAAVRAPAPEAIALTRDLLRYESAPELPPVMESPELRPSLVPDAPASPPPTERLVGFVRRGGVLFAALNLLTGETVVWSVGPQSNGYQLVALDEERGVRLRRPDGTDLTLPAP